MRHECGQRGCGACVPQRPPGLPGHPGRDRGHARAGRGRARVLVRLADGGRRHGTGGRRRADREGARVSWVLAFLGFAVLIILHEAGHFAAAKWVGMRVERFSLFFPPLLARRKVGETEYAVGAIPLGGYVKITGMNPHEDVPPEAVHRAYYRQPVWKRIVVIAAGPLVNIVLAFLILWVLIMLTDRQTPAPRVERVTAGMPAATLLRPGDRIVAVDGRRGKPEDFQKAIASHTCQGEPKDGCRAQTPAQV